MKKILLILLFMFILLLINIASVYAVAPGDSIWNRTYDTGLDDVAWDVAIDSKDNIYVGGWETSPNNPNWRIMKFDIEGVSLWNRTYSFVGSDILIGVGVDSSDNIYAVGNDGTIAWRVKKLDSDGNTLWDRTYDFGGIDEANNVAFDSNDNVYVVGRKNNVNTLVMKLDSKGISLWNRTYTLGGSKGNVAVDSNDNVYVASGFNVRKLDSSGNTLWDTFFSNPNGVAVDLNNNVYVTGSSGRIEKFDSNGISLWNGDYDIFANDVAVDNNNFVYVVGFKNQNWNILKFDGDGVNQWNRTYDLGSVDRAQGVATDSNKDIYVVGYETQNNQDWRIMKIAGLFDIDDDGIPNEDDNCIDVPNPQQEDVDNDGIGDACDVCPNDNLDDVDGDGVCGDIDLCPNTPNIEEANVDGCSCSQINIPFRDCTDDQCEGDFFVDYPEDGFDVCIAGEIVEEYSCESISSTFSLQCLPDGDNDGIPDINDLCPDSQQNELVDDSGCDIFQFCSFFDVSCGSDCVHADWRNNEPDTGFPRDCTLILPNDHLAVPRCVPLEFSNECAG